MIRSFSCTFLALFAGLLILATPDLVLAGEPVRPTVVHVDEMCGGCVKKISKRFEGVKGVAKVQCSIEKKSVTVIPDQDVRLSPKGVWELMESIGKTPTKMVTQNGTFTSKPKS